MTTILRSKQLVIDASVGYRLFTYHAGRAMLDAMIPAYEAIDAAVKADQPPKAALAAGVAAAEKGVEYTKTIIATKGRASSRSFMEMLRLSRALA